MADSLLLHNPGAKRGRAVLERILPRLVDGAREFRPVGISEIADRDTPCERIVAVGGDGTVNAAVRWIVDRQLERPDGEAAELAIVPAGTGNNLARGLGLPLGTDAAARLALSERPATREVDLWEVRGRPGDKSDILIQSAALGFPADIAARYDRLRKSALFRCLTWPLGTYVYQVLALAGLRHQRQLESRGENLLHLRVELPGEVLEETVLAVFIGNEGSLGGNFTPCPRSQVDDGRIDLCLVRAGTGMSYLELFRRIARGDHLDLEEVIVYRQSPGPVELALSGPRVPLVDGDIRPAVSSLRIERLAFPLRVIVG